jgi:epoxyqueuosine reductase
VALGNTHDPRAAAPLARALRADASPLVRSHAAWALGELGPASGPAGRAALLEASRSDTHPSVREEAAVALERLG